VGFWRLDPPREKQESGAPMSLPRPALVLLLALLPACRLSEPSSESIPPTRVLAAQAARDPRADDARRILAAALAEGRAYEKLTELCTAAPHRLAGSAGAEAAVQWARRAMIDDGLENVRLEPVPVPHWERGELERLVFTAPPELAGEQLPILALGGSVATPPGGVEAEVIVVHDFDELEQLGPDAEGRIVLFNRPMDETSPNTFRAYGGAVNQRTAGAARAAAAGAVASIARSMTTLLNDVPHTGVMHYAEGGPRIPAVSISTNGADRIEALLGEGQEVRLRLELACESLEDTTSWNVVGELVGAELPGEIVVVGGHLDAWDVGQGAHDDGAGCVQSMEALRLLKSLGLRPRRTIRCVLFMNEEFGITGGPAYFHDHRSEMADHLLAIEADTGGFTPRGFTTNASPEARAILQEAAALLAGTGAEFVKPGGGGADIGPMAAAGVPLAAYRTDPQRYFDVHHSPLDTLDAVN